MRNQEVTSSLSAKRGIKTILMSSGIGIAVILLLTAAMALLLTRSKMTNDKTYYFEFLILAVGALLSGFICAKKGRGKGIFLGAAASLPVMAVFLLVPYLMFETSVTKSILISVPIILVFSIIGGIVGANKR